MAYVQKGTAISGSTVIRSIKDRVVDNETQRSVEREVVAEYPAYLALLPAKGSAVGITGMPLVKYRGCNMQQHAELGTLGVFILTYNQQEPDTGELPPQPVLREASTANLKPWPEHPEFRTGDVLWPYYDDDKQAMSHEDYVPASIRGRRYYVETAAQVSYTQYFGGDPGTVQTQLGKIEPPPGESASGGKWMIVDGTRQREGRWWSRTLVYEYNPKGWATYDGQGASV